MFLTLITEEGEEFRDKVISQREMKKKGRILRFKSFTKKSL